MLQVVKTLPFSLSLSHSCLPLPSFLQQQRQSHFLFSTFIRRCHSLCVSQKKKTQSYIPTTPSMEQIIHLLPRLTAGGAPGDLDLDLERLTLLLLLLL